MKNNLIYKYSNPIQVLKQAKKYLGKNVIISFSEKENKKYKVFHPELKKWIYFGEMGYEDFTKHQDLYRRENYLKRTEHIKGDWKNNKYSPNNLSRNILW